MNQINNSDFIGYVDIATNKKVCGWAWNPTKPNQRLDLDIYLGPDPITRITADNFREDLLEAKIGDGRYSFDIDLELPEKGPVTVKIAGTDCKLPSSSPPISGPNEHLISPNSPLITKSPNLDRYHIDNHPKQRQALIVGAAENLTLPFSANNAPENLDIFALNSAHTHLVGMGIIPKALISGDGRYIKNLLDRTDLLTTISKIVSFSYAKYEPKDSINKANLPKFELFTCLGRDGISFDADNGFYHGCSSFFLAIQYLYAIGYRKINVTGVHFPPPEMYKRLGGKNGHPEFVYHIQLDNMNRLAKSMQQNYLTLKCLDKESNLRIFLPCD